MRILMMGTGPFAVPTFDALCASSHDVTALVTRPTRPGRKPPPNPMREAAERHGLPVYDPADVNSPEARDWVAGQEADVLVVCDYGQILAPETLATARLGGVNLHASLLPAYRGAAPINWAIYHGETETGNTVIHMTPKIDAGPCIAQEATAIGPEETAEELEERLAAMGGPLVVRSIDDLAAGRAQPIPQDPALASKAPRLKKTDSLVDWARPAAAISDQVRSMKPWPRTCTYWHRAEQPPFRLILDQVHVASAADAQAGRSEPGTVLIVEKNLLAVSTGDGVLTIEAVQPSGKRVLPVEDFLRGYPVRVGDRFGADVRRTG